MDALNELLATSLTQPRWYHFDLLDASGAEGGRGSVLAVSPCAAEQFATHQLAGTSTVRLRMEIADA
ncbi:hypothetical protein GTU73_01860 [Rathayibacter sp. VKM Ac-2804]|uniref:hypothetical protein n=1 Tax=Rathayibacter sp. VKM Ac-2804 TaxID=2609257 RepID=UPI00132ED4D7|nr:hypothetical protein [Rathayibacter sp. VKM Ac-2804]QHF22872.1 hypothetical protein GTU73_01860 [Rathayibacter sp. VKM Ac-2804]